jgi:hypothetical protein
MKLTPEEKRTVELVEKAISNWVTAAAVCFIIGCIVQWCRYKDQQPEPGQKLVLTMRESDLRDIIRQEIRK